MQFVAKSFHFLLAVFLIPFGGVGGVVLVPLHDSATCIKVRICKTVHSHRYLQYPELARLHYFVH